ncbi:MAG TPA: hypothetical protein VF230_05965 [Acidimicrobiales bacterium]
MTMPEPHLDDERVSALLDGEDDATAQSHLATCDRCRARFDRFASVRAAMATPVEPLDAGDVDRLVSRALSAAVGLSPVTSIADARSRRRAGLPAGAVAAIAALFIALVGLPALLDRGESNGDATTAEHVAIQDGKDGDTEFDAVAGDAATGGGKAPSGTEEFAEGDVVVEGPSAASSDDEATSMPAGAVAGSAGRSSAGSYDPNRAPHLGTFEKDDDLVRVLVAKLSTERQDPADISGLMCRTKVEELGGSRLGSWLYVASATWRTSDAEVFVYSLTEPEAGDDRRAFVMSVRTCSVLAEPHF